MTGDNREKAKSVTDENVGNKDEAESHPDKKVENAVEEGAEKKRTDPKSATCVKNKPKRHKKEVVKRNKNAQFMSTGNKKKIENAKSGGTKRRIANRQSGAAKKKKKKQQCRKPSESDLLGILKSIDESNASIGYKCKNSTYQKCNLCQCLHTMLQPGMRSKLTLFLGWVDEFWELDERERKLFIQKSACEVIHKKGRHYPSINISIRKEAHEHDGSKTVKENNSVCCYLLFHVVGKGGDFFDFDRDCIEAIVRQKNDKVRGAFLARMFWDAITRHGFSLEKRRIIWNDNKKLEDALHETTRLSKDTDWRIKYRSLGLYQIIRAVPGIDPEKNPLFYACEKVNNAFVRECFNLYKHAPSVRLWQRVKHSGLLYLAFPNVALDFKKCNQNEIPISLMSTSFTSKDAGTRCDNLTKYINSGGDMKEKLDMLEKQHLHPVLLHMLRKFTSRDKSIQDLTSLYIEWTIMKTEKHEVQPFHTDYPDLAEQDKNNRTKCKKQKTKDGKIGTQVFFIGFMPLTESGMFIEIFDKKKEKAEVVFVAFGTLLILPGYVFHAGGFATYSPDGNCSEHPRLMMYLYPNEMVYPYSERKGNELIDKKKGEDEYKHSACLEDKYTKDRLPTGKCNLENTLFLCRRIEEENIEECMKQKLRRRLKMAKRAQDNRDKKKTNNAPKKKDNQEKEGK